MSDLETDLKPESVWTNWRSQNPRSSGSSSLVGVLAAIVSGFSGAFGLADVALAGQDRLTLYSQLQTQVADQQWQDALETVDQLLILDPGRSAELQPYRQQLLQLQQHPPLPELPQSTSPAAPSPLRVLRATAAVVSVRTERSTRRINLSDPREPIVVVRLSDGSTGRLSRISTVQEYPDLYEIKILFSAPVGIPTTADVTITLMGGGESTLSQQVQAGGAVVLAEESFIFSADQVPYPQRVQVEIENGPSQIFPISLPSRETLLEERDL